MPLTDSTLLVAVIDDGLVSHADLPASRIRPGKDFYGKDFDPRPGTNENHGMACAGILGASHNGTGAVGVFGSCRVLPVKIFGDHGEGGDTLMVGDAIYYATRQGARVMSNSWAFPTVAPNVYVANAIRYAVNSQNLGQGMNSQERLGAVMVFAAGNYAQWGYPVLFPANMPEVIAVGAVDKSGARWGYSCNGTALDVMAPSGNTNLQGDQWTVDQSGDFGWNPYVTGFGDTNGDRDYTSKMGGTSGACPQVAGIAALLLARGHSAISFSQPYIKVREIIANAATDMGPAGWDPDYGYGRANAYRAMLSIIHGDVNNDGVIDVLDFIGVIDVAFSGGNAALDNSVADVNCDWVADVLDVIALVGHLFNGDPAPAICYE